jgi:AmmeMemoRadiSam system protein A
MEDIYTKLAYDSIRLFLEKEELPDLKSVPMKILSRQAGCFVSLKKDGKLRGCIGTVRPNYKNLGGEIEANAIAASQHDPRFEPVKLDELINLKISVDILSEPEQIFDEKYLDIKKYGVIVQASDGRDGLLLPDIDGIKNIKEQITIAREKGGVLPDEEISLFRFTVERHKN